MDCNNGQCKTINYTQFDVTTANPLKVFSKFSSVTQGKYDPASSSLKT